MTPAVVVAVTEIEASRHPPVDASYQATPARFATPVNAGTRAAVVVLALAHRVAGLPRSAVKIVRWLLLAQTVLLEDRGRRAATERAIIGRR